MKYYKFKYQNSLLENLPFDWIDFVSFMTSFSRLYDNRFQSPEQFMAESETSPPRALFKMAAEVNISWRGILFA